MKISRLNNLFFEFLIIGASSFGGYMSLVSVVNREFVTKQKAILEGTILEAVSLASFLPGPIAVNVVAFIGYKLSGFFGALVSVVAVLLPSFILVCLAAIFYFDFGYKFSIEIILVGIIPVVIANIGYVGWTLFKKNCYEWSHYLIFLVSFSALFFITGYWAVVVILIASGLLGVAINSKKMDGKRSEQFIFPKTLAVFAAIFFLAILSAILIGGDNLLSQLFVQFSKVSLTLFGGGYVMVPLLKSLLVDQMMWIDYKDFMIGISIGQITPGPILISSAFFGYKVAGLPGAAIATLGIFFPSSLLMIGASEVYTRIKNNHVIQSALLGIKPAVIGLIFFSAVVLFKQHIVENNLLVALILVGISFFILVRWNIHIIWILLAAAVLGYFLS